MGATGVKQVFEVFRQMKGQCGDYQQSNPNYGVSVNMGGDDRNGIAVVQCNLG